MPLQSGARLGPYVIGAPLGAGGMGEVYRARDSRLDRDVAVKVLPDLFAGSPERLARFQREAQVLASLNHPNIAAIYGIEDAGTGALILELVEGPTLAERTAQGPIAVEEALPIARQIADALEAAHARGIVHRDLKPANVKLRPDGTVKVLDFGLAKALDTAVTIETAAATKTSPAMTHAGVVLGTAAYMAPEQAKGREVDARADIWAFGCVVYEMLTGTPPFAGESVSEVLADVLRGEPRWDRVPPNTPAAVIRLLRRCLQKDPARRLQHIGDARLEIDDAVVSPEAAGPGVQVVARRYPRLPWIVAGVLAVTAAALAIAALRPAASLPEMRLDIATPVTGEPFSFAISPDGQKVVFVAHSEGRPHLWLRRLDSASAQPLPGTEFATSPFWSPDSGSIGFHADTRLKRFVIETGSVHIVNTRTLTLQGASWSEDGTILFAPFITQQLYQVPASGGTRRAVTRSDPDRPGHRYPHFLPGGRRFLYYATGAGEVRGVYAGSLDMPETIRLFDADTPAVYSGTGHVLFVHGGKLLAQRFDPSALKVEGQPRAIADGVAWEPAVAAVSAAPSGPIVFRSGAAPRHRQQFLFVDRSGKEIERVGEPDEARGYSPALSADGRRVALHRNVNGAVDIWWFDMARRVPMRLTTAAAPEIHPLWSPDGSEIIYNSREKGVYDIYRRPVDSAEKQELVLASASGKRPLDWSPDGKFLLYVDRSTEENTGGDIWAIPLEGEKKPFPVVATEFEEPYAQFSPDVKWIAYETDKTGRWEIFVRPFRGQGMDTQVSTNGGSQVRWRRDGSELFYIALDGRLMAMTVRPSADGANLTFGSPVPLFATQVGGALQRASLPLYTPSPDGKTFLMLTVRDDSVSSPLTVLLNWKGKP